MIHGKTETGTLRADLYPYSYNGQEEIDPDGDPTNLRRYRRLSKDYEVLAESSGAFIYIASINLMPGQGKAL